MQQVVYTTTPQKEWEKLCASCKAYSNENTKDQSRPGLALRSGFVVAALHNVLVLWAEVPLCYTDDLFAYISVAQWITCLN